MMVKSMESNKIISGSCGYRHSCVLTYKGEIYTFGRQHFNKLINQDEPTNLDFVRPTKLKAYYKSLTFCN